MHIYPLEGPIKKNQKLTQEERYQLKPKICNLNDGRKRKEMKIIGKKTSKR